MTTTQQTQATTSHSSSSEAINFLQQDRVREATGYSIKAEQGERSEMEKMMVKTWADPGMSCEKGHCCVCDSLLEEPDPVRIPVFGGSVDITPTICDKCEPLVASHFEVSSQASWHTTCPAMFQDIIMQFDKSIGKIDVSATKSVSHWEYGKTGLYIYGKSGAGKTASVWAMYRRLEEKLGFAPVIVSAVELAGLLARNNKNLGDLRQSFLCRCRVLVIDDLGKQKVTEAFASALFDLINHRYENYKPIIITSKYDSKKLIDQFAGASRNDSLGFDVCRRLSDICEPVKFQ
jgi:hypothetical protein